MSLNTPVVLLIFNRPETTKKVFAQVKKAQPPQLFVVADGARFPEEEQKCLEARAAIMDNIDWDCEVFTNFSDVNLGCKHRVSSGLDWVFSQVEEAIMLEDDCLPTDSFFPYCETLLEYYRDNEQIMHIGGTNLHQNMIRNNYSYYFSKYNLVWGWATWRRAWKKYDIEMKTWPEFKQKQLIKSLSDNPYEQKYWINTFQRTKDNKVNTWDYQWTYACFSSQSIAIIPQCNLISNIGHGKDSTHSIDENDIYANLPTKDMWDIKHPPVVEIDKEADAYTFDYVFGGKQLKENDTFYRRFRWRLSKTKQDIMKFLNIHRESRE